MTTLDELKAFFLVDGATFERTTLPDTRANDCVDCTNEVRELVAECERLASELHDATHPVPMPDEHSEGVLVYRVTGDRMTREPVAELLIEFNARGKRIAELERRGP
jgi:hypothetical protein